MFILIILTSSNEDIIEMVVNGDYHEFEPEKLRGLMKILPEMDEVKLDLNVLMIMMRPPNRILSQMGCVVNQI